MGSGSCHLAQITGPAKDNGKGARGATLKFFASGSKQQYQSFQINLTTRDAPGIVRSRKARTGAADHSADSQADECPRRRLRPMFKDPCPTDRDRESNQANRAISTSQLNASPRLHIWPINVVVFHGSDREHSFQGGFPA